MGPEALAQVLRQLAGVVEPARFPDLLRGLDKPDDAAVLRLDDSLALVLTSDFFPPVVDDPFHFGAIAAANSLSDVYAMGARPLMAINLVGFPSDLDQQVLFEILRGGAEKAAEAGAPIAGGHTTVDKEPKYGLAVIGSVHPQEILSIDGARPTDRLFLTKPLGTGVITTAHKADEVLAGHLEQAIASMERLNAAAAGLLRGRAVHAVTDVTGFSLAGHAHEMALHSAQALSIRWESVPRLAGAGDYAEKGFVTGGARRNREYYGQWITWSRPSNPVDQELLYDPQTSGGLLVAVAADSADELCSAFEAAAEPIWEIGEVIAGSAGAIEIV